MGGKLDEGAPKTSEEDEEVLREKAKGCEDKKGSIRYLALHSVSIGDTLSDTAKRFLMGRSTVYY